MSNLVSLQALLEKFNQPVEMKIGGLPFTLSPPSSLNRSRISKELIAVTKLEGGSDEAIQATEKFMEILIDSCLPDLFLERGTQERETFVIALMSNQLDVLRAVTRILSGTDKEPSEEEVKEEEATAVDPTPFTSQPESDVR